MTTARAREQAEARRTDPAPSHGAAKRMNHSGGYRAQCDAAEEVLRAHASVEGWTCAELADTPIARIKFGTPFEAYIILGKRMPDLRDKRKIAENGAVRRCTIKGVPVQTWRVVLVSDEPKQERLF